MFVSDLIQCPDVEPKCSIVVRVCFDCEQKLSDVKKKEFKDKVWEELITQYNHLTKLCADISEVLHEVMYSGWSLAHNLEPCNRYI